MYISKGQQPNITNNQSRGPNTVFNNRHGCGYIIYKALDPSKSNKVMNKSEETILRADSKTKFFKNQKNIRLWHMTIIYFLVLVHVLDKCSLTFYKILFLTVS